MVTIFKHCYKYLHTGMVSWEFYGTEHISSCYTGIWLHHKSSHLQVLTFPLKLVSNI